MVYVLVRYKPAAKVVIINPYNSYLRVFWNSTQPIREFPVGLYEQDTYLFCKVIFSIILDIFKFMAVGEKDVSSQNYWSHKQKKVKSWRDNIIFSLKVA